MATHPEEGEGERKKEERRRKTRKHPHGASKDNTGSTMVPTTVEMVTLAFQPTSIPTGVPHRRLEIDCQLVITHPVPPIRIEGVRSAVPKFRPWNVAVALPECGEF